MKWVKIGLLAFQFFLAIKGKIGRGKKRRALRDAIEYAKAREMDDTDTAVRIAKRYFMQKRAGHHFP